jgi:2-polyprenyl-3-methyl-5-hydroxy-6-metoxy-1,4-benzoquinol methylase
MNHLTDKHLRNTLRALYKEILPQMTLRQKLVTIYRPYYAPIKEIIPFVPSGASVLEIGCGTGPVLQLLYAFCHLTSGLGIDIDGDSIELANKISNKDTLKFKVSSLFDLPLAELRSYNTFLFFDIFHHIPAHERQEFLTYSLQVCKRHDIILFKDLDSQPWYKAAFNSVTDYLSTRSVVSYTPMQTILSTLEANNFAAIACRRLDKLLWSHYLIVGQKR